MTMPRRSERGSALVAVIGIIIILSGLALIFTRQMRVEALAAGNQAGQAQAEAVVEGAARYVIYKLENNTDRTELDDEVEAEAVHVGDGWFWIVRPNPDDESMYAFGLVDEASKLNINSANSTMLMCLNNITQSIASSIVDWYDEDSQISGDGGAEDEYYLQQSEPYYAANTAFETLDELLMVKGVTADMLYGLDLNRNGVIDEDEKATDSKPLSSINGLFQCGPSKYLTVYSQSSDTVGLINVNTAPKEVLRCLPGITDSDVELLVSTRKDTSLDLTSLTWVSSTLSQSTYQKISSYITVTSYQYSADIVGVSANGKSFKRVKYVFDLRSGKPTIISAKDLTPLGWPLSQELRESLRAGDASTVKSGVKSKLENS